ncbi:C10 family peptidase [Acidobacteriota bacterium]
MKKCLVFLILFLIFSGLAFSYNLTLISKEEANLIASNWLNIVNLLPLEGKLGKYEVEFIEEVTNDGKLLCEIYHLYPKGHILVPSYKEFPPIKSFSIVSDFNNKSEGYEAAILMELKTACNFLEKYQIGTLEALESALAINRKHYDEFIQMNLQEAIIEEHEVLQLEDKSDLKKFIIKTDSNIVMEAIAAVPLLKTKWDQGSPYWNWCPVLWGSRCYVGCVATAMAQIMRYYKWPNQGIGSKSYYWEKGNQWLYANFSDSYDWNYMPNTTREISTNREKNAVAEISSETGISVEMDYGYDGSSAYIKDVASALKTFFRYSNVVKVVSRRDYGNVNNWFEVLKEQRDFSRPVEFSMRSEDSGHAVVMDGYLISGNSKKVHINMGWGGSADAYYTLDNILEYTDTLNQHAVIDIIPMGEIIRLNKNSLGFTGVEGKSNPLPKYFEIKNLKTGILNYKINANKNWISVEPDSGHSTGEWDRIRVSIKTSSLLEGTYNATISTSSQEASNSPQEIEVELIVKPPPIYAPKNFSGYMVENRSSSQLEHINVLSWQENLKNSHIEKYRICLREGERYLLLDEVDAKTFEYWHRKVDKNKFYRYALQAVDYKVRAGKPAYCEVQ